MEDLESKVENGETFDLFQFNPALSNRVAGTVFKQPEWYAKWCGTRYSEEELDIDAAAKKAERLLRKRGCAFDKIND